jgi:peptidoglycan/LPS O-acetylase OafA/YrhL
VRRANQSAAFVHLAFVNQKVRCDDCDDIGRFGVDIFFVITSNKLMGMN